MNDQNSEPTQAERVLRKLRDHPDEWVSMPALYEASGAYAVHSRVAELRLAGHHIECKVTGARPRKSFYRIVTNPQPEVVR